jgi:opacity protein-like surface antigen
MHTLTRIGRALYKNLSAKIEYLFIDFGDGPTVAMSPALCIVSGKLTDNIMRAGINYKSYD